MNSSSMALGIPKESLLATGDNVDVLLADALRCGESFLVSETSLGDVA